MNYKTRSLKLAVIAFLFGLSAIVISCDKSGDPMSPEAAQTASNEATQDSQQDEVDDIATAQLNASDPAGRMADGNDERVACALITVELGAEKGSGTITIDFDHNANGEPNPDGCTDARGNVRKGKIIIHWEGGRWFMVGSVITITLDNYSINRVVINGTRTLTNITANVLMPTWTVEANHTATWPDNTTATRIVHKTKAWEILAGKIWVTQTAGADFAASGTNRRGVTYTMEITKALEFNLECARSNKVFIPVSGTKVLTFNHKIVTIDYGTGECDNTFTVTFEHRSAVQTARNDDSE